MKSTQKPKEMSMLDEWWNTDHSPNTRMFLLFSLLTIVYSLTFYYGYYNNKDPKIFVFLLLASASGILLGTKQSTWYPITKEQCLKMCDSSIQKIKTSLSGFVPLTSLTPQNDKRKYQNSWIDPQNDEPKYQNNNPIY